jgi:thymidylate synthase (FAD)
LRRKEIQVSDYLPQGKRQRMYKIKYSEDNMNVELTAKTSPERDMSIEEYVIFCARVSSPDNRLNNGTAPKLMKYLIDHKHLSPFEMVSFAFEIETSRAIAQQLIRHRSFSFQEFSQRYAKVLAVEPVEHRFEHETNRQSSSQTVTDRKLNSISDDAISHSFMAYEELLEAGVAKETARMVLPLATTSTLVMHGTLRSWIHFLDQRCDVHAQKEIRNVAFAIRNILIEECPWLAKSQNWSLE